jgi:RNA polymerase sigma-70 factor (ECF subfamily)
MNREDDTKDPGAAVATAGLPPNLPVEPVGADVHGLAGELLAEVGADATPSQIDPVAYEGESPERCRSIANAAMDRYANGDGSAFPVLYDLLAPRLHKFLLRQTCDAARAEDLLQQTMLQIHRLRGRFREGGNVTAWAYAIARRLLIDSYRRRTREASHREAHPETSGASPPAADALLAAKRFMSRVEEEVSRLPERQRTAFELVTANGLSCREVAEILGTTTNAVKLRVHRANTALRSALGEPVGPEEWEGGDL